MCGIAGYYGSRPPNDASVHACLKLMARRGPDATGWESYDTPSGHKVTLLHSRLAIIDRHDRANQPMRRGQSVLTINGQLFNYRELRQILLAQSVEFRTESDTEVFLEQLEQHGLDGLDACEGMWAFAWYRQSGELVLCRDRFGEKPLYLMTTSHGAYWASEIKYIRELTTTALTPDATQLQRYLLAGYKAVCGRSRTFWEGVSEIPAGTALCFDRGMLVKSIRYWRPEFEQDESMSLDAAIAGVRERLETSVRLRMRSDAPIAFCMSGGVDSNALIALAKPHVEGEIHGFTIASRDTRFDEATAAKTCASQIGVRHTTVRPDANQFLDGLTTLVRQHDAPVLTISYYLHWLMMRAMAQQGYRVSISGTGADELLTGYYEHHNLWLAAMADSSDVGNHLSAWREHIGPLVRNPALKEIKYSGASYQSTVAIAGRRLAAEYLMSPIEQLHTPEGAYATEPLRNRMLNELFHQVVPAILHEDDLNAMHCSIENRSPFLDRHVAEFCFKIPTRHLIHDAYTKYPLRRALDGRLPREILWNRHKIGFNGSIRELLDPHSPAVKATIMDGSAIFDLVRRDRLETLLGQDTHTDDENKLLFFIISAQAFLNAANSN